MRWRNRNYLLFSVLFNYSLSDKNSERYIPAFSFEFLTPLYDFVMRWITRESVFKPELVRQMEIAKEDKVLDLGCGTATSTILIKKACLEAELVGFDVDLKILGIAQSKIKKAGFDIALNLGTGLCLPYRDSSFDRVASSMVLHHLTRENKIRALKEVFRVLQPDGELHIADFGKPQNIPMYFPSLIIRHLEEASDSVKGMLPEIFQLAGVQEIEEKGKYSSLFGTVALYKMRKPEKK